MWKDSQTSDIFYSLMWMAWWRSNSSSKHIVRSSAQKLQRGDILYVSKLSWERVLSHILSICYTLCVGYYQPLYAQGEEEEYIYTNELLSSPRGSNLMLELEILCMHLLYERKCSMYKHICMYISTSPYIMHAYTPHTHTRVCVCVYVQIYEHIHI